LTLYIVYDIIKKTIYRVIWCRTPEDIAVIAALPDGSHVPALGGSHAFCRGKVKREAGEIPARSRRCIGEIFQTIHWLLPGRVEKFRIRSQKTCHIATPELYGR
jgi:hypothetical protein